MRLGVFTLCSNQGVSQATLLMETIGRCLPDADRFLVLADVPYPGISYPAGCTVIAANELGIGNFPNFSFRYDRQELTAAIKPFAFLHLMRARGYTHCLYFDPDIELFNPLPGVMAALQANASFILTPHILVPAERRDGPDDIAIMRGGTFNLGFLGVSGTREAHECLGWWSRWLRTHCVDDRPIGLFIDQKFMDLIPGIARGTRILRDPGLNVAPWNLSQRRFQPDAPGGPVVDDSPLGFFHYSGFDPAIPDLICQPSDCPQGHTLPPSWRDFFYRYAGRLRAAGHGQVPSALYAYGRFASGIPIPDIVRRMFRDDYPAWSGNPFENFEAWAHQPARGSVPGIGSAIPSLIMQWLHARTRKVADIPLSQPAGAASITRWWLEEGITAGVDRRFLEPQAAASGHRALSTHANYPSPHSSQANATIIAPFGEPDVLGDDSLAARVGHAQRVSLGLAVDRVDVYDLSVENQKPINGCVVAICTAPDRVAAAIAATGPRLRDGPYRIFIPAAERISLTPSWLAKLSEVDEIWAPTRFIQSSLVLRTSLPVLHMPVAWDFQAPTATDGAPIFGSRPYILADSDGFPGCDALRAAVQAYVKAFGAMPPARRPALAVLARAPEAIDGSLQSMITAYQGIIAPPAADPTPLIAGAACLLALHRGDALGLSVLRAMAFGVPVVTTDYGGCTDVLNPRTGFPVDFTNASTTFDTNAETWGESMVEADPDCAAWSLHDLFARPDLARARAAEAQRVIQTLYDPADVAAQQRRRLCRVKQLATRPYNGAAA